MRRCRLARAFLLSAVLAGLAGCGGSKGAGPTAVQNPASSPTPTVQPTDPNSPNPSAVVARSNGGAPDNGIEIEIANAATVDGKPLKTGEALTLQAVARDIDGSDISEQIEWVDEAGEALGTGATLSYTAADEAAMAIVTAKVKGASGAENYDRVSFTVSPADAVLAANVKVLPDEAKANILQADWENNRLQLRDNEVLPTIATGDVLVGAQYQVRPVKVVSLEDKGDTLELELELAFPRDIIKQGIVQNWQEVRFDEQGNVLGQSALENADTVSLVAAGCGNPVQRDFNLPIASIPNVGRTVNIPNRWDLFKEVEPQISVGLDASVGGNVGFCPVLPVPSIEFNEQGELFSGIREIEVTAGIADVAAELYLEADAVIDWSLVDRFPDDPIVLAPIPLFYAGQVGPVSVWIRFDVLGSIPFEAGVRLSATGMRLGASYSGGEALQTVRFSSGSGWDIGSPSFNAGSFSPIHSGQFELDGFVQVGLNPEIEPEIWASPPGPLFRIKAFTLPKVGVNLYAQAALNVVPDAIGINVNSPTAGTDVSITDSLRLSADASGDPEVTIYT